MILMEALIRTDTGFKLIILDECDNMTKDAQMALRRGKGCHSVGIRLERECRLVMEDFMKNVRFCLMCNHPNSLLPAIRSRCAQVRFPPLEEKMVKSRLTYIIQQEKQMPFNDWTALRNAFIFSRVSISSGGLDTLIKLGNGDMRHALNTLQAWHLRDTPEG